MEQPWATPPTRLVLDLESCPNYIEVDLTVTPKVTERWSDGLSNQQVHCNASYTKLTRRYRGLKLLELGH